jgi:hypothetical protein
MGRFGDGQEDDQRLLIVCWLHINAFIYLMNFFTFCYHHVTCELVGDSPEGPLRQQGKSCLKPAKNRN